MTLEEEKRLVELAKTDPKAFGKIYDHHFPYIFNYIFKRVLDEDVARELISNVFFKALKKLNSFKWRGISISSWLFRIAVNEINFYFRNNNKVIMNDISLLENVIAEQATPESELNDIEDKEYQNLLFLEINKEVRKLKPIDQEIITLRFFEKKRLKEIGDILGKSENVVKVRLHRALKKLQKSIEKTIWERKNARIYQRT